jgi:hypothetical protein
VPARRAPESGIQGAENNVRGGIANEAYYLSADGRLIPTKKNQAPPERRYFKQYRGKIAPQRTNCVPVAREHAHGPVRVKKARRWVMNVLTIVSPGLKVLFERVGKPEVINRPEVLQLSGTAAVIACNHIGWVDSLWVAYAVYPRQLLKNGCRKTLKVLFCPLRQKLSSLVSVAKGKIVRQNRHFQRFSAANFACQ